jgi:hypothetical protein
MFSLGLDYHNVIDKYPEIFGTLSRLLMASGSQVYIITGHAATPEFAQILERLGIEYTEILSIVDYHKRIGTQIRYDEKGDPWIDEELWNSTKADLCKRYKVTMHVDDSEVYGKYFTGETKYLLLK